MSTVLIPWWGWILVGFLLGLVVFWTWAIVRVGAKPHRPPRRWGS